MRSEFRPLTADELTLLNGAQHDLPQGDELGLARSR
jgi:hypothetical protein